MSLYVALTEKNLAMTWVHAVHAFISFLFSYLISSSSLLSLCCAVFDTRRVNLKVLLCSDDKFMLRLFSVCRKMKEKGKLVSLAAPPVPLSQEGWSCSVSYWRCRTPFSFLTCILTQPYDFRMYVLHNAQADIWRAILRSDVKFLFSSAVRGPSRP